MDTYRIDVRIARRGGESITQALDAACDVIIEALRASGHKFAVELVERVGSADRVLNFWVDDAAAARLDE